MQIYRFALSYARKPIKKMQNKKQNHIAVLLFRSGETGIRNRMVEGLRLRNEMEQEPSLGANRSLEAKRSRTSCPASRSGETGIRTQGTVARTPHFECGPFDHSGISPEIMLDSEGSPRGDCPVFPNICGLPNAPWAGRAAGNSHNPEEPLPAPRPRNLR